MDFLSAIVSGLFTPITTLRLLLRASPQYKPVVLGGALLLALVVILIVGYYRKYFILISKSLTRNLVRTFLSAMATIVLVFVATLVVSILVFLAQQMEEKSKDLKAIVTERYQIPSQMPMAYADTLEKGAARPGHPEDIIPADSMTWQFFGGTLDPNKRAREDQFFFFAMDPRKIRSMMDDLDNLDPALVEKMIANKRGVLLGKNQLEATHKRLGDRFTLTGLNYKDMALEFEIVGGLPDGRYNQNGIMNRDYLNDALDAYKRSHNGEPHPMADKTLNLVWIRVPDPVAFQKVAGQVMSSPLYTSPSVKCETASSGISSFMDAYRDLIWGMQWLLVPAILVTMSLVIANAISISVRERRTEMAVLKVLGYSPARIMAMVLGESVLIGAGSGLLSAAVTYLVITVGLGGLKFPIAFFSVFEILPDAMWWGFLFGGLTSLAGSIVPALSARNVKVSEVFAKVA